MAWTVDADGYETSADLTNGVKTIRARMNKGTILRFARTWVVFYNDPDLTNITMKIYYDESGSKGDLLYSSITTLTKAQIITLQNGIKEVYFEFDDVVLDANNYYHFVLTGVSSGFSSSSHLAWKKSYPYPVYTSGFAQSFRNRLIFPYTLSLVGAEF